MYCFLALNQKVVQQWETSDSIELDDDVGISRQNGIYLERIVVCLAHGRIL